MLALLLVLIAPISALANEDEIDNWNIKKYNSYLEINSNGSIDVKEYITFRLDKDFDGIIIKYIDALEASSVESFSIGYIVDENKDNILESEIELFSEDSYELILNEEFNVYDSVVLTLDDYKKEITLVYSYVLNDFIQVYNDSAFLKWNILKEKDTLNLREFKLNMSKKIDAEVELEDRREQLIGPLLVDTIFSEEDNKTEIYSKDIYNGDIVFLMLIDKKDIPEGRKIIENNIEDDFISYIKEYNEDNDLLIKKYKSKKMLNKVIFTIVIILIIFVMGYFYKTYKLNSDKVKKTSK